MTRKEALAELIEKVEAGSFPEDANARELFGVAPPTRLIVYAYEAFGGSLDAAKALHEAVLPVAWAHVRHTGKYGHATVDVDGEEYDANNADTPARAWLIAILRALYAQETDT